MKKFFIALSVLAALFLTVAPSQALVGMPDDVPGCDILQGFFMVETTATGLDSLVIFQEVSGNAVFGATEAKAAGILHWVIRDVRSNHLKDSNAKYSANDVVAISVRDLITNYLTDADRTALTQTINGVSYYIGYIDWENNADTLLGTWQSNNMIAKMYLINLAAGKACGVNLAAKEWMDPTGGWLATQYQAATIGNNDADFVSLVAPPTTYAFEGFSAQALAGSEQRERAGAVVVTAANVVAPTQFRLLPRYYLYDSAATNLIFIWKSANTLTAGGANAFTAVSNVYDTEENPISTNVNLPYELNVLNMIEWLPPIYRSTFPAAGWIDITIDSTVLATFASMDFLGYNVQTANNASATLNWSALFQVAREVYWTGK